MENRETVFVYRVSFVYQQIIFEGIKGKNNVNQAPLKNTKQISVPQKCQLDKCKTVTSFTEPSLEQVLFSFRPNHPLYMDENMTAEEDMCVHFISFHSFVYYILLLFHSNVCVFYYSYWENITLNQIF